MAELPFGAEASPGGGTRFRLWAPTARRVELCLDAVAGGEQRVLPMSETTAGWRERVVPDALPGSLYRFRIDGELHVPDPASRFQPRDVHGASRVESAGSFAWTDREWTGRPWEETVLYELHVGSFTREGTYDGVRSRLEHLARLGVTAVELMPLADFPGARNWGYDGVLPFAPDSVYGSPDDLRRLVDEAHRAGLMVFVDVVYNHFGPEGNYLHRYADRFFSTDHRTPWGAAINFDGTDSRIVRQFFIENALFWLEEHHVDGLRLDAVHAIRDDSGRPFLDELAEAVHAGPGARRQVHLVLENDANQARPLERDAHGRPRAYAAQWNDDVHHALHCLLTGEASGYYEDYSAAPARHLARSLAEGFAYQGEHSGHRGRRRGESSRHLPPTAFVNFLQNHDQVGNRAFGERLTVLAEESRLRTAASVLLLSPAPPLLFMGEEFGCRQPFPFFCDFGPDLARAVFEGRRKEFERFEAFSDPATRERIPDPNAEETFRSAVLDWSALERNGHPRWLEHHRSMLELRHREIVPRLSGCPGGAASHRMLAERAFEVEWTLGDGSRLSVIANLSDDGLDDVAWPEGRVLTAVERGEPVTGTRRRGLEAWSAAFVLDDRGTR